MFLLLFLLLLLLLLFLLLLLIIIYLFIYLYIFICINFCGINVVKSQGVIQAMRTHVDCHRLYRFHIRCFSYTSYLMRLVAINVLMQPEATQRLCFLTVCLVAVVRKQNLYTVKNIRRFYDKITGNQLPIHFPLFFTGARKHFQESGTER